MTGTEDSKQIAAPQPEPREGVADLAFSAFVFVLAAVFFIQALSIDSNAELWPRALALMLLLLSGVQIVRTVVPLVRLGRPKQWLDSVAVVRRLFAAAWLITFCIVAQITGFGVAMLVLMPVYMWIAGFRRPVLIVLITALSAAGITLLFGTVASVPIWEADL